MTDPSLAEMAQEMYEIASKALETLSDAPTPERTLLESVVKMTAEYLEAASNPDLQPHRNGFGS